MTIWWILFSSFYSLLHGDSVTLLWNVVWCLVQLSGDVEISDEIRVLGGLPILLALLQYVNKIIMYINDK